MKNPIIAFLLLMFCNMSLYSQNIDLNKEKIIRLNDDGSKSISNLYEFDLVKKHVYQIGIVSNYLHVKGAKLKYKVKNIRKNDWVIILQLLDEIDLSNYHKEKFDFKMYSISLNNETIHYLTESEKEIELLKKIFNIIRK
jgi:hypothetical protein